MLDLFLSTSMGRPPATSDVDCTVPYAAAAMPRPARVSAETDVEDHEEPFDVLNASVQIFLIAEEVVVEVYSRKKISYQLTEGISCRLRDWSIRWLHRLKSVIATAGNGERDPSAATGACQVLCSYYYGTGVAVVVAVAVAVFLLWRSLLRNPSPRNRQADVRSSCHPGFSSIPHVRAAQAPLERSQPFKQSQPVDGQVQAGRRLHRRCHIHG